MKLALPGSALVHAGAVSLLVVGFAWPEAEDAAPPAPVTVDIVPVSTVASNATEVIAADNTVSSVSAGTPELLEPVTESLAVVEPERLSPSVADAPTPIEPPPADPAEPEVVAPAELEPLTAETVEAEVAEPPAPERVEPLPIDPIEPLEQELASVAESELTVQPVTPVETEALQPVETQTLATPRAMPTPSSERPPDQPVQRETPRQQPRPEPEPTPPRQTQTGNSGNSNADSAASAGASTQRQSNQGAGGEAEVARYPSQVIGRLRNAMRQGGSSGEVVVRFTVRADGGLTGVGIARSSGNAEVDAAGTALVQRAAPFPPIPPASGRTTWTFDVPLSFGG